MNWRRTVLSGVLTAGLMTSLVSPVSTAQADSDADHHHHRHDRRGWYHARYSGHDGDRDREWREHRWGDHDRRVEGDNTRDCGAIHQRIRYNREQIRIIEPTGRHKKALQWYKDDIQNARNDLRTCRG